MSAEALLERIEQLGLLEDNVISSLRKQVLESGVRISAETVVQMLVDKQLLTSFQGKKLLSDIAAETMVMNEEELGLVLEEDEEFTVAQPPKVPNQPRTRPAAPQGNAPQGKSNKQKWKTAESSPPQKSKTSPPPPPELEVIEDAGDELIVLDDAQGLTPLDYGDPLAAAAAMEADPLGMGQPTKPQRAPRAPREKKNPWESALIFVGGGGLIVLLLVGGLLFFVLSSAPAEEVLAQADESYKNEQYLEAIERYDQFLDAYPDDENASRARVRRSLARLRHVVRGARDWKQPLAAAQQELPKIENEADFPDARDELAAILPQIVEGFTVQARQAKDIAQTAEYLDQADAAMKLVDNPVYISSQQRKGMETRMEGIIDAMLVVRRDVSREQDLAEAVQNIEQAAAAGETAQAYQLRDELLKRYPGLSSSPALQDAVSAISKKQRELVTLRRGGLEPTSEERYASPEFQVVLAGQSGETARRAAGKTALFVAEGALYGLDAATGAVKWRRFLGYEPAPAPTRVQGEQGDDVLAVDPRGHHLLRLHGATGELQWRVEIGQPLSQPVATDDAVLVTDATGKLYALDPATGVCRFQAALPQSVSTSPAVDAGSSMCYLAADHSNVYAFSLPALECLDVHYLGHAEGSISAAPIAERGFLLIAENSGPADAQLRVFSTGADGAKLQPQRVNLPIKGRVLTPLMPQSGRILAVSDLGAIHVFDVDPSNKRSPVTQVALQTAAADAPGVPYAVAHEGQLFVGDTQLTKYEIQTSRGQLIRRWQRYIGDDFFGTMQVYDDVVVHLRRRQGGLGLTATASRTDDGADVWQTSLGAPLAGEAFADTSRRQLIAVTSAGQLFEIDQASIGAGFLGKPSADVGVKQTSVPALDKRFDLGEGRLAYASRAPDTRIAYYDPMASERLRLIQPEMPADSLSCPPVLFQGGLLMPASDGRVYLVDPASGKALAKPFQPPLGAGGKVEWRQPAVVADGSRFVIADNRRRIYSAELSESPEPNLSQVHAADLSADLVAPLAVLGDVAVSVKRGRRSDTVCTFTAELADGAEAEVQGRIVWGPYAVGDQVLAATDRGQLLAYNAAADSKWSISIDDDRLTGAPLLEGESVLLAATSGVVRKINLQDGAESGRLELGQPLGAAPTPFVGRLLLTGSDGVIYLTSFEPAPSS